MGTDHAGLVEWLRGFEGSGSNGTNEAADAIESLKAETRTLTELRELAERKVRTEFKAGFTEGYREALIRAAEDYGTPGMSATTQYVKEWLLGRASETDSSGGEVTG